MDDLYRKLAEHLELRIEDVQEIGEKIRTNPNLFRNHKQYNKKAKLHNKAVARKNEILSQERSEEYEILYKYYPHPDVFDLAPEAQEKFNTFLKPYFDSLPVCSFKSSTMSLVDGLMWCYDVHGDFVTESKAMLLVGFLYCEFDVPPERKSSLIEDYVKGDFSVQDHREIRDAVKNVVRIRKLSDDNTDGCS